MESDDKRSVAIKMESRHDIEQPPPIVFDDVAQPPPNAEQVVERSVSVEHVGSERNGSRSAGTVTVHVVQEDQSVL